MQERTDSAEHFAHGQLSAKLFSRNCGATTGFYTQLSIVRIKDLPYYEAGNVFIADGQLPVTLRWLSDTWLSVAGTGGSGTFKQEASSMESLSSMNTLQAVACVVFLRLA